MVKIEAVKMEYKEIATPLYVRHLLECQECVSKYDPLEVSIRASGYSIDIKRKPGKVYSFKYTSRYETLCGRVSDKKSWFRDHMSVDEFKINNIPVKVIYREGEGYDIISKEDWRFSTVMDILKSIELFDLLTRYESEGYIKIK